MALDKRILKDLNELHGTGVIHCAKCLDGLIPAKSGQTSFATGALPCYFWGDRKAKTVMVMLNPGEDVANANANLKRDLSKRSMRDAADISNYKNWSANYGHYDRARLDSFDLKQAFFLLNWTGNTGVTLPTGLCAQSNKQTLLDAKEAVLTQKLQLELIPYASGSFGNFNSKLLCKVFPFVETLFEEVFSQDREYIIFCSRKFEKVFKAYNKLHPGSVKFIKEYKCPISNNLRGTCTVIEINYNGKSCKAIIANTFPSQALHNAYKVMAAYGDFCYNCLLKHLP